jgi:nucleoside-diphosphate-sugar epimerase
MKALFIGGTGVISSAVAELAVKMGWELYLLNRGISSRFVPDGVKLLQADINSDEPQVALLLQDLCFDVVADFVVFTAEQAERDIRLFRGKTSQYILISSATVYQKPPVNFPVREDTSLSNPFWDYAQNKIKCENILTAAYQSEGFPLTIVRPSHTYSQKNIPLALGGRHSAWQVIERIKNHKPVIVPGDGSTLWTITHSTDLAKAFVGLMANPHAVGECFHITSDEALTWNKIYEIIGIALGVAPEIIHIPSDFLIACDDQGYGLYGSLLGDKANNAVFDNAKIKRTVPDFVCTTRLDQGVRQSLRFLEEHPEYQRSDAQFDAWCDKVIHCYQQGLQSY